jgi:hypothetical protein
LRIPVSIFILFILPAFLQAQAVESDSANTTNNRRVKLAGYPAGGYSPETSVELGAVGVLLINDHENASAGKVRPTTFSPYFLFTFKGQFLSAIKSDVYFSHRYYLNANIRFFNYPDLYFGTGPNVSGVSEKFTDQYLKLDAKAARIFCENTFAGLSLLWEYDHIYKYAPGGMLESGSITGYNGGNIFGLGPYYRFDSRNNVLFPSKGWYVETSFLFFPDQVLNDYSFTSFQLDLRYFTTVFSKNNILALQAYYNFAGGSSIPFYLLPRLGGDTRLRGIKHENYYRDRNAYYFQFEGRRELFWRIGGVLFAGVGGVDPTLSAFRFNELKYVFGIGGRFRPFKNEKLHLRLDIGKGPGSQYATYISVGEAF